MAKLNYYTGVGVMFYNTGHRNNQKSGSVKEKIRQKRTQSPEAKAEGTLGGSDWISIDWLQSNFFAPKNFDKKWRQPTADVVVVAVIVVAVDFMVVVIVIVVVVIAVVAVPVVVDVVDVVVIVVVAAIVTFVFNLDILRLKMSQVEDKDTPNRPYL